MTPSGCWSSACAGGAVDVAEVEQPLADGGVQPCRRRVEVAQRRGLGVGEPEPVAVDREPGRLGEPAVARRAVAQTLDGRAGEDLTSPVRGSTASSRCTPAAATTTWPIAGHQATSHGESTAGTGPVTVRASRQRGGQVEGGDDRAVGQVGRPRSTWLRGVGDEHVVARRRSPAGSSAKPVRLGGRAPRRVAGADAAHARSRRRARARPAGGGRRRRPAGVPPCAARSPWPGSAASVGAGRGGDVRAVAAAQRALRVVLPRQLGIDQRRARWPAPRRPPARRRSPRGRSATSVGQARTAYCCHRSQLRVVEHGVRRRRSARRRGHGAVASASCANFGECTPMMTSDVAVARASSGAQLVETCRQLTQQNVQKSSSTKRPRRPARVSGRSVLSQPPATSSGARTRGPVRTRPSDRPWRLTPPVGQRPANGAHPAVAPMAVVSLDVGATRRVDPRGGGDQLLLHRRRGGRSARSNSRRASRRAARLCGRESRCMVVSFGVVASVRSGYPLQPNECSLYARWCRNVTTGHRAVRARIGQHGRRRRPGTASPAAPSTRRWSKDTASWVTQRGSIRSSRRCRPPTAAAGSRRRRGSPASPGLRIGVPVSTPKTPTLVIVIVPPDMSAGERLAGARGLGQLGDRLGQLEQRQLLGVLDVRHDQAARRWRRRCRGSRSA